MANPELVVEYLEHDHDSHCTKLVILETEGKIRRPPAKYTKYQKASSPTVPNYF